MNNVWQLLHYYWTIIIRRQITMVTKSPSTYFIQDLHVFLRHYVTMTLYLYPGRMLVSYNHNMIKQSLKSQQKQPCEIFTCRFEIAKRKLNQIKTHSEYFMQYFMQSYAIKHIQQLFIYSAFFVRWQRKIQLANLFGCPCNFYL